MIVRTAAFRRNCLGTGCIRAYARVVGGIINSPPPPAPSPQSEVKIINVTDKERFSPNRTGPGKTVAEILGIKKSVSAEPFHLDISKPPVQKQDDFKTVREPPMLRPKDDLYDYLTDLARNCSDIGRSMSLKDMLSDLDAKANAEVPHVLKNGNAGSPQLSLDEVAESVVTIAHILPPSIATKKAEIILSSGFAILDGTMIATCAHPLHQINAHCRSYDANEQLSNLKRARTLIITNSGDVWPVLSLDSHLVMSDLVLLRIPEASKLSPLKVSPYPCPAGNLVQVYNLHETALSSGLPKPKWSWQDSEITVYQDRAGREAATGSYDELNTLLFNTIPRAGSSGGPILDRETKAVIGITRGSEVSYAVRKERGFAAPAESLFNVFKLEGF